MHSLPYYMPHSALNEHGFIAYAGACFDEPEEGDRIYIDEEPYEFRAEPFERDGQWYERFGWYAII